MGLGMRLSKARNLGVFGNSRYGHPYPGVIGGFEDCKARVGHSGLAVSQNLQVNT